MNEVAEVGKATVALLLAVVGFWHLFNIGKWLANAGDRLQMRRRHRQGKGSPSKNASIEPR